jgi:NAD(P)-dependent dehydrogenase (short-subunit alcohol dehydrogenase family)
MRMDGRIALVTGGGRGIGRATAVALATRGAEVIVAARSGSEIDEVADEIHRFGGRASAVVCDVTQPDQVKALIEGINRRHGALDVLVNNAGGAGPLRELRHVDARDFQSAVALNLASVQTSMQAAAPLLFARPGRASVINVSSIAAASGLQRLSFYSAAKAGVEGLSRAAAREWGSRGVRVNCVAPGWIDTRLSSGLRRNKEFFRSTIDRIPLSRWGEPAEIAAAITFLASDASAYITGVTLVADGGLLA